MFAKPLNDREAVKVKKRKEPITDQTKALKQSHARTTHRSQGQSVQNQAEDLQQTQLSFS